MKKTYSKIIFSVVMLSLAIFSASFGIYAIMTAEMNMNLNIGYVAYNCSANVSGVITGASLEAEGEVSEIALSNVEVNGKNKQTQSMDLGTFYFTTDGVKNALGKPYPIKVWFTIENTSEFPICVEVSLPTITDVEVVADKTSHVIQAGETDKIMVTFTLTNISTTALERGFSSSGLNFTFKKFLKTKHDIVVYKDASVTHFENHPYYIKFGNYFGTADIIWLVGGTIDVNGQTIALTDADRTQLDTGKFAANKDYYLICGRSLYGNSLYKTIIIQNNLYWGESIYSADGYLQEYTNIDNVIDYSLSTIRQYLIGHTVNAGAVVNEEESTILPDTTSASTNFVQLYNLEKDIYALIKKRNLTEIYKTLGYGNTELAIPTDKADNLSSEEADAFWIPTDYDISVLGDDNYSYSHNGSMETYFSLTRQSSNHAKSVGYYYNAGKVKSYINEQALLDAKMRPAFII